MRPGGTSVDCACGSACVDPRLSRILYRALKRAGTRLAITARPHQARTTFATFVRERLEVMNESGANLDAVKVVQFLLAHADSTTTEQYLESIDVPSLEVLQVLDELTRTTLMGPGVG